MQVERQYAFFGSDPATGVPSFLGDNGACASVFGTHGGKCLWNKKSDGARWYPPMAHTEVPSQRCVKLAALLGVLMAPLTHRSKLALLQVHFG